MALIRVERLVKEFHRVRRRPGLGGALRNLVAPRYETVRAVDDITFSIDEGELVGYIGSNGAGKSTTIKMLAGILVPTAGAVEVGGLVPWRQRERNARQIGVVFGQRTQLWWDLPLIDSFRLTAKMYDVPDARYHRSMNRFTSLLGLDAFMHTPVRQLSLGQRMRGELTAAMLYEPSVLYLDEPTIGLDVLAKERILGAIQQVNEDRRTTFLLTTHDLDDIERLCRRIIVIDHGRVLYDGRVEPFKARYAARRQLVVQLTPGAQPPVRPLGLPGADMVASEPGTVAIQFDPERIPVADLVAAVAAAYPVRDLSIKEPALGDIVRDLYVEREGVR